MARYEIRRRDLFKNFKCSGNCVMIDKFHLHFIVIKKFQEEKKNKNSDFYFSL